jgi:hypothetical protein
VNIRKFFHRLKKSSDNEVILSAGFRAAREVLRLDKNMDKPVMPRNVGELLVLAQCEFNELDSEIKRYYHNPARIRAECGDLIAYISAIARTCEGGNS